jgi:hypothetical protein
MKFRDWQKELQTLEESLRELNEAFDPKDEMRISDIVKKSGGDKNKQISLASTMAKVIKDADKATRRAEAAESLGYPYLAEIFYDRAAELSGGSPVRPTKPATSKEEDSDVYLDKDGNVQSTSADFPEEKPAPRVVAPKKPLPVRRQVGDFFRIDAKMILDGNKVGLSDGKHWRFITATSKGDRQWEIQEFRQTKQTYRRGQGYTTHRGQEATAYIDKAYLESLNDQAIFYVKASKVSSSWVEGRVHYPNGLEPTTYLVRFKLVDAPKNGPELDIFLAHQKELSVLRESKRFFSGDEMFIMDEDGREYTEDFSPGSYTALSLNYDLTLKKGEPVFYVAPADSPRMKKGKVFFIALSDWLKLETAISKEKAEVVADYLSKQIGAQVSVKSWESNGDTTFSIPWFKVEGDQVSGYLSGYDAKPFFTIEAADKHVEELKNRSLEEKLPYSTKNLVVKRCSGSWSEKEYEINFAKLMDYAKLVGIEVKLRKFFEEKRGAVASKKFAF